PHSSPPILSPRPSRKTLGPTWTLRLSLLSTQLPSPWLWPRSRPLSVSLGSSLFGPDCFLRRCRSFRATLGTRSRQQQGLSGNRSGLCNRPPASRVQLLQHPLATASVGSE